MITLISPNTHTHTNCSAILLLKIKIISMTPQSTYQTPYTMEIGYDKNSRPSKIKMFIALNKCTPSPQPSTWPRAPIPIAIIVNPHSIFRFIFDKFTKSRHVVDSWLDIYPEAYVVWHKHQQMHESCSNRRKMKCFSTFSHLGHNPYVAWTISRWILFKIIKFDFGQDMAADGRLYRPNSMSFGPFFIIHSLACRKYTIWSSMRQSIWSKWLFVCGSTCPNLRQQSNAWNGNLSYETEDTITPALLHCDTQKSTKRGYLCAIFHAKRVPFAEWEMHEKRDSPGISLSAGETCSVYCWAIHST